MLCFSHRWEYMCIRFSVPHKISKNTCTRPDVYICSLRGYIITISQSKQISSSPPIYLQNSYNAGVYIKLNKRRFEQGLVHMFINMSSSSLSIFENSIVFQLEILCACITRCFIIVLYNDHVCVCHGFTNSKAQ